VRILQEPRNALLKQYEKMFEIEGIGLTVEAEALRAVARKAIARGTGARGLRAVLEETMLEIMFDIPSRDDVREVVLTAESVEGHVPPLLVLDPATQTYLGGSSLKAFQPYGESPLRPDDIHPIEAGELAQMAGKLGAPQPWSRLAWLCALVGHRGTIAPGVDPNAQFKLNKWPQTEREFPKHFRIATVMMKGPALLTEIAEASGVGLDEVIDYVNASLAAGVAEAESGTPAPVDAGKGGGLLGRFRR